MVKPLPPSRKRVRKSFSPVLIAILTALPLVVLAGLHALLLIMAWLGSSMKSANGGEVGLMSWVLLALATGTTVASAGAAVVGVLLAPRRPRVNSWRSLGIGWCLLAVSVISTIAMFTIDSIRNAQLGRELDQRYAPKRLAENRDLLDSALIKAECADGVTLTLNRKVFSDGDSVMSVRAIPADRSRQNDILVILGSDSKVLAAVLATDRSDLETYKARGLQSEPYKSQGLRSCQLKIDAMLTELESFVQSHSQP